MSNEQIADMVAGGLMIFFAVLGAISYIIASAHERRQEERHQGKGR